MPTSRSTARTSTGPTSTPGDRAREPRRVGSEPAFVTGLRGPVGIAVDGAHLYWSETESGTIGRANLDGSGVDEGLLTGLAGPVEVAVDANHIYWTNNSANTVGRAALDGSGAIRPYRHARGASGVA